MKTRNALLCLTGVLAALGVGPRPAYAQCVELKDPDRARLADYVKKKYKAPPGAALKLAEAAPVGGSCYRRVVFQSDDQKRRVELYLSPDLRFLSRDLLDSSIDPVEEERRKQEALEAGLFRGAFPVQGPKDARVTLTIFSDFQCPYCAKLYEDLKNDVLPSQKEKVRLVYRHMPLSMHPWARTAAEAAACAYDQGNDHFWGMHDFIFLQRGKLTTANIADELSAKARVLPGLDGQRFDKCMATHAMAPRIDQDIAFARENGISATPTLFVNGHRVEGAAPPEQILTLIRQLGPPKETVADIHGR